MGSELLLLLLITGSITILVLLYAVFKNPLAYRKKVVRPAMIYARIIVVIVVMFMMAYRSGLEKNREITEQIIIQYIKTAPAPLFVIADSVALKDTAEGYALIQKNMAKAKLEKEIYKATDPIISQTQRYQSYIFFSGLAFIIMIDLIKLLSGYLVKKRYKEGMQDLNQ